MLECAVIWCNVLVYVCVFRIVSLCVGGREGGREGEGEGENE